MHIFFVLTDQRHDGQRAEDDSEQEGTTWGNCKYI
jgi:hypothetical protein